MKTVSVLILLVVIVAGLSASAFGVSPSETVRAMLEEVMGIQTDAKLQGEGSRNARKDAIEKIILKNFDIENMAKHALGPQWEALNKARQHEFKEVFQDLFVDSYTRLVLDFLKREKIDYAKEESGQAMTVVRTVIQRANEAIPVDYSLAPVGNKLLVRDVRIDGVSIVGNYRKSFGRVIKQESYEGLIKKMRLQQQAAKSN